MSIRQVILDTETTGLDPKLGHRIIEIAAVEIIDRQITDNYYQCYINPQCSIDPAAVKIHGITDSFLTDKPVFHAIVTDFFNFVGNDPIIIHNAPFDVGFLNHELMLCQYNVRKIDKHVTIIDTLEMARREFPGQRNSLDALCKRFHVDLSERQLHGALLDARLLAKVYLAMTGGQGSLFGEHASTMGNNQTKDENNSGRINTDNLPLKVVLATDDEQKAHANYCQSVIKKNSNRCLWDDC